jgi:hypothetical protein
MPGQGSTAGSPKIMNNSSQKRKKKKGLETGNWQKTANNSQ